MKISRIVIKNFKGLSSIDFELSDICSVIVGPNAIGKSSIFEAIRLSKALLFPNFQSELQVVAQSLKINSPTPNELIMDSMLNDITRPLEITLYIKITDFELNFAETNLDRFAIKHLQNTLRFPTYNNTFSEIQFLSSDQGQTVLEIGRKEIRTYLADLKTKKEIKAGVVLELNKSMRGLNLLDQEFLTILFTTMTYRESLLNYFPAERALPPGDQGVQIGHGNVSNQISSYIANPQIKYQQIKSFLISMYMTNKESEERIKSEFNKIFQSLVRGKELVGVEINQQGSFSIRIRDTEKKNIFDMDSMSSGEKNLILTILLMKLTTHPEGIILFDEPELHLNPAVQKIILDYLIVDICKDPNRQLIIATHSPEILSTAFERDDCRLLHLISGSDISPILPADKREVFSALNRLGASTPDVLFTRGVLYLEGESDVTYLQSAISELMPSVGVKSLGGRGEIEKEIKLLQDEERKGQLKTQQYFILDRDRKITDLKSSDKVRILQWDRYAIENYLLDSDSIYDVIVSTRKSQENTDITRGSLKTKITELAMSQITTIAQQKEISDLIGEGFNTITKKIVTVNPEETFRGLEEKLIEIQKHASLTQKTTEADFVLKCRNRIESMTQLWNDKWKAECNGKLLLNELQKLYILNVSADTFKRKILDSLQAKNSEEWQLIKNKLNDLLIQK